MARLAAHADDSVEDNKGKTAMRWAELKSREIAELLRQHAIRSFGELTQARQRLAFARCGHWTDIDVMVAVCAVLPLPPAYVSFRAQEEAMVAEGLPPEPRPDWNCRSADWRLLASTRRDTAKTVQPLCERGSSTGR